MVEKQSEGKENMATGMEAFKEMLLLLKRDDLSEQTKNDLAMFFYSVGRSSLHALLVMRYDVRVAQENLETTLQWLDEQLRQKGAKDVAATSDE